MLANLLPGLRDLRAPLSAGFLLMLALWIAFYPELPSRSPRSGFWSTVFAIEELISPAGLGVALSFAAYLLGSVSEGMWRAIALRTPGPLMTGPDREVPLGVERAGGEAGALRPSRQGQAVLWRVAARAIRPFHDLLTSESRAALGSRLLGPEEVPEFSSERFTQLVFPGTEPGRRPEAWRTAVEAAIDRSQKYFIPLSERAKAGLEQEGEADDLYNAAYDVNQEFRARLQAGDPQCQLAVLRQLLTRNLSTDPGPSQPLLQEAVYQAVVDEGESLRTRLLATEPDLFSKVDRLRAESDFRAAVVPPLLVLAVALAWRAAWWAPVPVVVGALVLLVQGWQRRNQSDDALIEALRIERLTSPTLEGFQALAVVPDQVVRVR